MKNLLVKNLWLLLVLFFAAPTYAATLPGEVSVGLVSNVEIKTAKAQRKAAKAEAKAQRKAARAAKYLAWVKRVASDPNWAAVILAFFLGWLGIHRVVMGGSGLLIVGYLFTFGGFFGILP
jgi:nucleotide-binding universal stress UspA family protein